MTGGLLVRRAIGQGADVRGDCVRGGHLSKGNCPGGRLSQGQLAGYRIIVIFKREHIGDWTGPVGTIRNPEHTALLRGPD